MSKERIASFIKNWKIWLYSSLFIMLLGLTGYAVIVYGGKLVVDEEDLVLDATTTIETSEGKVIWELYNEKRYPVDIDDIPNHVQNAFIAIEDKRFVEHAGVDFKSVMRAIYSDIIALDKVEGASTITQQLAKNLFLYNDKTWMRKTKEVMAAIYLERTFSKKQILELYLNKIYFGHGVHGIEAASQHYFSKSVTDLSIAEGALLAGIVKAPNGYSPINHTEKSLERRNLVLKMMNHAGMISTEMTLQEQGKTLGLNVQDKGERPWLDSYIDLVLKEAAEKHQLSINELKRGGYRISVHIDERIQQIAHEKLRKEHYFPGNAPGVEAAFVMMEEEQGNIVSAVGGRDYRMGDLNRATVKRQPGSVIKPLIVYAPAMMKDEFHPFSLIRDEQIDYDGYKVSNYDNVYDGMVTIYDAITKSKNASAVWLLNEIGIDYAKEYLKEMNIVIPDDGLAIALGGLSDGMTPIELVKGYRTFIHQGEVIEPHTINQIYHKNDALIAESTPDRKKVFADQVAWDMTEILSTTVEEGTANAGAYKKALAGKTGTTEHPFVEGMVKDAWFVGYTPRYVTSLWMGYDRSDQEHYLTQGSTYPTILVKDILTEIDKRHSLEVSFSKPAHVNELPKPIELPEINHIEVAYEFGGFPPIKGKVTWESSNDERVMYRIYREVDGIDEKVGEVVGGTEFIIQDITLLSPNYFYVVPYNPLTKMEGERSETVELSFK